MLCLTYLSERTAKTYHMSNFDTHHTLDDVSSTLQRIKILCLYVFVASVILTLSLALEMWEEYFTWCNYGHNLIKYVTNTR